MTAVPEPSADNGVLWSMVEDGFHVGSRNGEFLGYIDRRSDDQFLACDMFSREIGVFTDLPSAMQVVSDGPSAPLETAQ